MEMQRLYLEIVDYINERDKKRDLTCELEPTSSGCYTLRVNSNNKTFYLHSNNNPIIEARAFANRYYNKEVNKYIVVGLGLGYHIIELIKNNPDMEIFVIESKLEVICQSLFSIDLSYLFNNNVSIIYDKEFSQLTELIDCENEKLLIHRPSIKYLESIQIADKLEQILEQQDYISKSENTFYLNIKSNITNCNQYVDKLDIEFKGKRVLIVAAGPSLDKNIGLLKNKPKDIIILAVGTIFHKLMDLVVELQ